MYIYIYKFGHRMPVPGWFTGCHQMPPVCRAAGRRMWGRRRSGLSGRCRCGSSGAVGVVGRRMLFVPPVRCCRAPDAFVPPVRFRWASDALVPPVPAIGTTNLDPSSSARWYVALSLALVTKYGPNHLLANFLVLLCWLSRLLSYTNTQSPSSIFFGRS